ncbi:aminoimidazole riboside kinase [Polycladomyces abyssicola]|uniref:Aminoimidazole riboside kinase n=1 Tax=Polycladomyces abyssicola TaxID=1125966 RepID=A0A8D5UFE3_9BACL|nr:aminoimidazole riboside kinase [Polycladomyces abyssicola]BCU80995.1 aminoimidazole riboside kinase [Polycladomyces abyssicola]
MQTGIVALGEALIDLIPLDATNMTYRKSPGGAPANVAVGVARLGGRSSFVGKVGNDVLGAFLKQTLNDYGVDTRQMILTDEARTGLVFVELNADGERDFTFFVKPSADFFLYEREIDEYFIGMHKILHFGSISLIREPAKSATVKAVHNAKKHGLIVSYDPNLRLGLWETPAQARNTIIEMLPQVDVLKVSEEELVFLTGQQSIEAGVDALKVYEIPLVFVTRGAEGSVAFCRNGKVAVPAMKVEAVDTTGAGDAYVSGILFSLDRYEGSLEEVTVSELERWVRFASMSGGLAASTQGAMTALPTLEQVQNILGEG